MLISQDARLEITRSLEFTMNSIVESQHQLESTKADRGGKLSSSSGPLSSARIW